MCISWITKCLIILCPSSQLVITKVSDEYMVIIFRAEDGVSNFHRMLTFPTKTHKLLGGKLNFSFTESKAARSRNYFIRHRGCTGLTGSLNTDVGRDARTNISDCTVSQPEDHTPWIFAATLTSNTICTFTVQHNTCCLLSYFSASVFKDLTK